MDEIMQRAAAVAAEADTITLTACREGYYPREMEVTEIRVENLGTVWMKVRTDATSAIALCRAAFRGSCSYICTKPFCAQGSSWASRNCTLMKYSDPASSAP